MEVCVDSLESALNAAEGGAARIELCSSLAMGGTTPTLGLLSCVKQKLPHFVIHVLIRCRDGDFLYTEDELQIMVEDVKSLIRGGADGIVMGCLDENGHVNVEQCKTLIRTTKEVANGRPINITFHRAFDMTSSRMISSTMHDLIEMGCSRILTSGQKKTAVEGSQLIRELIAKYSDEIIIMPGGGLSQESLRILLTTCSVEQNCSGTDVSCSQTKPGVIKEFHASARVLKESQMKYRNESLKMGSDSQEYTIMVTSSEKVRKMVDVYNQFLLTSQRQ